MSKMPVKAIFFAIFLATLLMVPACFLNAYPGGGGVGPADPGKSSRPNIIFIAIEDFNPAHMGCYGGQTLTPNIDQLADKAVIFRNASCDNPVCNPSRTALLTGVRPPTSGVFGNTDNWKELILPRIQATLPEHLKNNGYETVKIGKLYHLDMEHPESWSRELPERVSGRSLLSAWSSEVTPLLNVVENDPSTEWFNENLAWGPIDCDPGEFRDGHMATNVASYLAEDHQSPFFLAVGFHAPHLKFAAPKQFFDLYEVNDIELPDNPPDDLADIPSISSKNTLHSIIDSTTWRDIIRAQFACMTYVDWCIGTVLESVRANQLEENTIVVIWTDHGLMLGEHFQWGKGGNKLYNETTKVGCIWKVPGMTTAGVISESVVETIDFFPTWFDLCNIDPPLHIQGKSFVDLLSDPSKPGKDAGFSWGSRRRVSVQTERFRLNMDTDLDPSSFELYDHVNDPDEFVNLRSNLLYADTIQALISYYQEEFPNTVPVEGVSVFSCPVEHIDAGTTYQLKASVIPINASENGLVWRSSNTDIATIDSRGLIRAIAKGTATIEVESTDGGYTDACEIVVDQVEVSVYGVTIGNCPGYILETGDTHQLIANIAPSNATDPSVTWRSSNPLVASVDEYGLVTGLSQGTTTITITTNDGGYTGTCSIGVMYAYNPVTAVIISGCLADSLEVGETHQLTASVLPEDTGDTAVTWHSSDTSIVVVDRSGLITAIAGGVATITAFAGTAGVKDECAVSVFDLTGRDEHGLPLRNAGVLLYPNPVSEKLHIKLPGNGREKRVTLYSPLGEILLIQTTSHDRLELDVDDLSTYPYLIVGVHTGEKEEYFKALLKQ